MEMPETIIKKSPFHYNRAIQVLIVGKKGDRKNNEKIIQKSFLWQIKSDQAQMALQ